MDLTVHNEMTCQVRDVLDRVGDKWTLSVVYELRSGRRRFTDLKRSIDGISQRMLTVTLRSLERDGLVARTVYPVVPPRVDYELTDLGQTLLTTAWELIDWAAEHADRIAQARQAYDGDQGEPAQPGGPQMV
jgi:DNA-binding HxlR family transcriptional regulator